MSLVKPISCAISAPIHEIFGLNRQSVGSDESLESEPVVGMDIETCQSCGGAERLIACIEDPAVIQKIVDRPKDETADPSRYPKARATTAPVTPHPGLPSHAPIRNPALATAVQSATPQAVSTSTIFNGQSLRVARLVIS